MEIASELLDHISDALLYFIHVVPRLKYLFQRWCVLYENQREFIDREMLQSGLSSEKSLYKSFRQAFTMWEYVQDTEGAPGFHEEANEYKFNLDLQEKITKMLNEFEINLCKAEIKGNHYEETIDQNCNKVNLENNNVKENSSKIKFLTNSVKAKRSSSNNKYEKEDNEKKMERRKSV